MKHAYKTLLLLLFFSAKTFAQLPAQTVPAFNFYMLDKTAFANKNLASGKMLFFLFFDPTCDHCQHAMTNLNTHYNDYKKAAVYLICLDSKETINTFISKYAPDLKGKKNITLLQDTKNEFITKFHPRKYPSMFLYDSNKKLLDYEDNPESMFRFSKYINQPVKKT